MFMTTNHLNRLDPALIRPGRVDVKQEIGYADEGQIERMFRRFYPQEPGAKEFARSLINIGEPKSIAQIQGHFMIHKNSAKSALEYIDILKD